MNDSQLWEALKNGDRTALARMYREHAGSLLNYAYKFTRDEQLAEDCLQELFVDLWNKRAGLGANDSIRRYLFVALRRRIIRELERGKKRSISGELEEYHFEAEIAIEEKIVNSELSAEQSAKLQRAVATLSKRQREVIYLKYFSEMDYEAIGEVMGVSYQSARNLLSTALKSLRKQFVLLLLFCLGYFFA